VQSSTQGSQRTPDWPEALLRLEEPAPGIAHLATHVMGDQVFLWMRCYLFGVDAQAIAASIEPLWQAWLSGRIPATSVAGTGD
jgi:hypothetical protein